MHGHRHRRRCSSAARALLKERLLVRPGYGSGGVLSLSSPFGDLVALWLADLDVRELAEATKESYRDQVRLHVLPGFEHFTLGEITTARVEWFLRSQAAISDSRARRSRTMLNLLFRFALRHDAIGRNPVEGTSPLHTPKGSPQALTLEQVAALRTAAVAWRNDAGLPGPKPDGQVRDIIEVLLGTAMRPGEVLSLRPRDLGVTVIGWSRPRCLMESMSGRRSPSSVRCRLPIVIDPRLRSSSMWPQKFKDFWVRASRALRPSLLRPINGPLLGGHGWLGRG